MIFIFSIVAGLQCSVNFLLYSKVTQAHIHVYILFSYIIMLHLSHIFKPKESFRRFEKLIGKNND